MPGHRELAELPIPLEALEDCGAILGRRGAGKSGTGRVLLEHELAAGRRCCAIDPKGDWWGIRMDKQGNPSGFDLPIFGGTHGDLALTEDMGEMLGRLVATHDLSCVVDLSGFPSQAAQRRFALGFAEALFEHNRQPITLFLDEADQLAPQRVPANMARLLHAMETLIRLGRQRGIFMWMLTQRPQVLNKNLLSQAESLVAMKVTTPHDRGAIRDWMEAHDPDQAKAIEKQLAKLDVGEAFVWVPNADFLERVRFPLFATYDSGRTPRHGETVEAVNLPTIDLSALQQALASVAPEQPESQKSAKPESQTSVSASQMQADRNSESVALLDELGDRDRRIAELEREVEYLKRLGDVLYQRGLVIGLGRAQEAIRPLIAAANDGTEKPRLDTETAAAYARATQKSQANPGADPSAEKPAQDEPVSRPAAGRSAAPRPSPAFKPGGGAGDITGPQQKVLDGLAWWRAIGHDAPSVPQLAFAARYSPKSTSFEKARGQLRSAGLVEYASPGKTTLTAEGAALAAEPVEPAGKAALHRIILGALTGPQTAVLGALIAAWPDALPIEQLAANSGYSPVSTSFEKARGQLRTLGLADYPEPGATRVEDWLFPKQGKKR